MEVMDLKDISPDSVIFWQWKFVRLNATIVFTWGIMAFLTIGSWLVTRNLSHGPGMSRWHNLLEVIVQGMKSQIEETGGQRPERYLYFIGTLFIFIAVSNLFMVVPGYVAPTASLSTTAALAICVFIMVPVYGITSGGLLGYLKQYVEPTPLMLPFNITGELSRTLALAVRLFGNIMSGTKIAAILLAVIPFIFPVIMHALGLLTGMIQAYIFAVLAMVYIASATRAREEYRQLNQEENPKGAQQNG